MVFHVLNRGAGRMRLFLKDADFEAVDRIIEQALATRPTRMCAYCLLSHHRHMVLWPERDGDQATAGIDAANTRPAEETGKWE